MADLFTLAQQLGAKNITNNPIARNYLLQGQRTRGAEDVLQSTKTPLGALSSGIALYVQRKKENQALEELNKQYEAENLAKAQRRESLIGALPEDRRVIASALSEEELPKYVMQTLTPMSEEEKLGLENKRLQIKKLQKEIENLDKPGQGNAPAGYRFTDTGDLEAIAGGPATKQSAESAGKIALIKQGLSDIESFENQIMDEDGTFNRTKITGLRTYGRPGARDEFSKLYNALNARLRLESGAAVPESEVQRAFETFAPSPLDSDATIKSKVTRLKEYFGSAKKEIGQGRGAEPIAPSSSGNQSLKSKYGLE